jgi:tryptophan synthase alpha subunit
LGSIESTLRIIVAFGDIMMLFPHLVAPSLEKLFEYVVFAKPEEVDFVKLGVPFSSETEDLRAFAASSLVKLGSSIPEILKVIETN